MAANIGLLLDKAKVIHRLPSDYKLALVMDVKQTTLTNYRQGKTLPDARVISLICDLTGDDPALLAAQIEEQMAKTTEARALWHLVAQRLHAVAAAAIFAVAFSGVAGVASPGMAQAQTSAPALFTVYTSRNLPARFLALFAHWCAPLARYLSGLCNHVQSTPSTAPA